MNRLEGKVAIVTGAARGLGRGIAERLASEGAVVVVTDVNADGAQQTATELGGSAVGLGCDVSDYDSVEAMVADVKDRFGRVDVLVNNAGWDKAAPFLDLERELWPRSSASTPSACSTRARPSCRSWPSRALARSSTSARRGARRLVGRGRPLGGQGRGHRLHQVDGAGDGTQAGPRQRRLPWPVRHAAVRRVRRRQRPSRGL